jgi:hypothetical protein
MVCLKKTVSPEKRFTSQESAALPHLYEIADKECCGFLTNGKFTFST